MKSVEDYAKQLKASKNIIFHGAPGTGKTYLAREVAAHVISKGKVENWDSLSESLRNQVEFVQFHPNYDYSDFVEGLRPMKKEGEGDIGFELRSGIFKSFVEKARDSYFENKVESDYCDEREESQSLSDITYEDIKEFLQPGERYIKAENKGKSKEEARCHIVVESDENFIKFNNEIGEKGEDGKFPIRKKKTSSGSYVAELIELKVSDLLHLLNSLKEYNSAKEANKEIKNRENNDSRDGFSWAFWNGVKEKLKEKSRQEQSVSTGYERFVPKLYVFIIDEINRGDISRIFGELFFSIDPGYRGIDGGVKTQYSNLHDDEDEIFYIPDNVYIIGTMNDIDRSVDSFDFAMRRRFRFINIKPEDRIEMLANLKEDRGEEYHSQAISKMTSLNEEIAQELGESYQVGPAYFKRLEELEGDFSALWDDYLEPLLREYVRGLRNEEEVIASLSKAYEKV